MLTEYEKYLRVKCEEFIEELEQLVADTKAGINNEAEYHNHLVRYRTFLEEAIKNKPVN